MKIEDIKAGIAAVQEEVRSKAARAAIEHAIHQREIRRENDRRAEEFVRHDLPAFLESVQVTADGGIVLIPREAFDKDLGVYVVQALYDVHQVDGILFDGETMHVLDGDVRTAWTCPGVSMSGIRRPYRRWVEDSGATHYVLVIR